MLEKLTEYIYKNPDILMALSRLETKILDKKINNINIDRPVYVTGLARSGTTITLEFLNSHKGIISHTYADYPFVWTPYFWSKINKFLINKNLQERAHKDGIMVNSFSPESMEELIWAHYFPDAHNPSKNNCLDKNFSNTEFENFYREHIKKLLFVKSGTRYLSKANYNLSRIPYLLSIFPDAKFIILVRDPIDFVASSIKQDGLFCEEQTKNPEKLLHTNITHHYEFGLNKKPINFGEDLSPEFNDKNNKAQAWAKYWASAYKYALNLLNEKTSSQNIKLIKYEELCNNPEEKLLEILNFCEIEKEEKIIEDYKNKIKKPSYYKPEITEGEIKTTKEITYNILTELNAEISAPSIVAGNSVSV